MTSSEDIRKKFVEFWTESPRQHKLIPNLSLVPNVDSTLLFVNSGMFPLVNYLSGAQHPLGNRLVNFQRCLRTKDDEVQEIGDNRHTLMFEMMGNWSLGDYFKEEQIPWVTELFIEKFKLDINRMYVTVFAGDEDAPRDDVSINTWKEVYRKYGLDTEFNEDIHQVGDDLNNPLWYRIFPYPKKKNWWTRAEAVGELGGPSSEIFYDTGITHDPAFGEKCHVNCDCGRFVEIGNNVFMEYQLDDNMKWQPLTQRNVDFGGGFERIVMCAQGKTDIFETDLYQPIINLLENLSTRPYKTNGQDNEWTSAFRVVADHGRLTAFLLADGVIPSSKDQGYILRRFIRRMVRFGLRLGLDVNFTGEIAMAVISRMQEIYPHLKEQKEIIVTAMDKEEKAFRETLVKGLKELSRIVEKGEVIDGKTAFYIYETYGFPLEMTLEELKASEEDKLRISEEFAQAQAEHRSQSQKGAEQKFKGGLADHSEETTKLHTAHHLLLAALQKTLEPDKKPDYTIHQRGSNITAERLRLDFNFERKLTPKELEDIEDLVNQQINKGLLVLRVEMPKKYGDLWKAQREFGQKYGDIVSMYFMVPKEFVPFALQNRDHLDANDMSYFTESFLTSAFSVEFCGGPHVKNTFELSDNGTKKFKILKEEASSAGVRRIKATLV